MNLRKPHNQIENQYKASSAKFRVATLSFGHQLTILIRYIKLSHFDVNSDIVFYFSKFTATTFKSNTMNVFEMSVWRFFFFSAADYSQWNENILLKCIVRIDQRRMQKVHHQNKAVFTVWFTSENIQLNRLVAFSLCCNIVNVSSVCLVNLYLIRANVFRYK